MAHGRAYVSIRDSIVQLACVSRPAGRKEILHVLAGGIASGASFRFLLHDYFVAFALVDLETAVAHRHPTVLGVEEVSGAWNGQSRRARGGAGRGNRYLSRSTGSGASPSRRRNHAFAPRYQSTHFKHKFAPGAEIISRKQRVWCFLIVAVNVLAAHRNRCLRPFRIAHAPACDTQLMHSLIADVAVAGVPKPMPVVLETQFVNRPHRRGPEKQIPSHSCRHRTVRFVTPGPAALA